MSLTFQGPKGSDMVLGLWETELELSQPSLCCLFLLSKGLVYSDGNNLLLFKLNLLEGLC